MKVNFNDGDEENYYNKMVKKRIIKRNQGSIDQKGSKTIGLRHRSPSPRADPLKT